MGGPGSGRRKAAETIQKEIEAERTRMGQQPPAQETPTPSTEVDAPDGRGKDQNAAFIVEQPTGGSLLLQSSVEADYYNGSLSGYQREFKFESVADLADLSTLLFQELLLFRYQIQAAAGMGYDGYPLTYSEQEQLRKNIQDATKTVSVLKTQMGITRAARDSGKESVADNWERLKRRARAFGVHRNNQVIKAIVLANELSAIVGTFDRSNDLEKRTVGYETEADIVEWVRSVFIPEFRKVDDEFKKTQQQWVVEDGQ